jgi:hypothetical protein
MLTAKSSPGFYPHCVTVTRILSVVLKPTYMCFTSASIQVFIALTASREFKPSQIPVNRPTLIMHKCTGHRLAWFAIMLRVTVPMSDINFGRLIHAPG